MRKSDKPDLDGEEAAADDLPTPVAIAWDLVRGGQMGCAGRAGPKHDTIGPA